MCSRNESLLGEIPIGGYCYSLKECQNEYKCDCEFDCECKVNLIKQFCPYRTHIENGLIKCILVNVTSDEDELFSKGIKICGFNELDKIE